MNGPRRRTAQETAMKPLEKIAFAAPQSSLEHRSRYRCFSSPPVSPLLPTRRVFACQVYNTMQRAIISRLRCRRLPEAIQASSNAHARRTTSSSVLPTATVLDAMAACAHVQSRDPRPDSNDQHRTKLANPDKRYATDNLQFAKVDARGRPEILYV